MTEDRCDVNRCTNRPYIYEWPLGKLCAEHYRRSEDGEDIVDILRPGRKKLARERLADEA